MSTTDCRPTDSTAWAWVSPTPGMQVRSRVHEWVGGWVGGQELGIIWACLVSGWVWAHGSFVYSQAVLSHYRGLPCWEGAAAGPFAAAPDGMMGLQLACSSPPHSVFT